MPNYNNVNLSDLKALTVALHSLLHGVDKQKEFLTGILSEARNAGIPISDQRKYELELRKDIMSDFGEVLDFAFTKMDEIVKQEE